mmetsp:Transcript_9269/g.17013  ORF Transcript_9269/g.17013 Transcript_9269/m.17013 type:complete len:315 (-) Transcript_9269:68-1012(-)
MLLNLSLVMSFSRLDKYVVRAFPTSVIDGPPYSAPKATSSSKRPMSSPVFISSSSRLANPKLAKPATAPTALLKPFNSASECWCDCMSSSSPPASPALPPSAAAPSLGPPGSLRGGVGFPSASMGAPTARMKKCCSSSREGTPTNESVHTPLWNTNTDGRAFTPNASANFLHSSLLIFPTRSSPPALVATWSNTGARALHGWHQSAYTSTITGTGLSMTNFWKLLASVTLNNTSARFTGGGVGAEAAESAPTPANDGPPPAAEEDDDGRFTLPVLRHCSTFSSSFARASSSAQPPLATISLTASSSCPAMSSAC